MEDENELREIRILLWGSEGIKKDVFTNWSQGNFFFASIWHRKCKPLLKFGGHHRHSEDFFQIPPFSFIKFAYSFLDILFHLHLITIFFKVLFK